MRKYFVYSVLISALMVILSAQCADLKKEEEKLHKKFQEIRKQISSPTISGAEYDKLNVDYKKAWSLYQQKKKERLQCEDGKKHQHKKFFNEGIKLKKNKKFAEAAKKFQKAFEIKSDFEDAYYQAAYVLLQVDPKDVNIDKYIAKIKNKTKRGKLYYAKAHKLSDISPKQAIVYYEKSSKYYKPEKAYYKIGVLYATTLFKPKKAVSSFKTSLKHKKDPKVYDILGATIMEIKPSKKYNSQAIYADAIKYLELGAKKSKGYKSADKLYARLAQVYNKRKVAGSTRKALKAAIKSLEISGKRKNGYAHLEKGKALKKLGKKEEARSSFLKAKEDRGSRKLAEFELKHIDDK